MNIVIDRLIAENPDAVIIVGFDDCLLGTCTNNGKPPVAVYSTNMIIENLMQRGLDTDEAWDHYYHNMESIDMGLHGPLMLNLDMD